jgi:murein DD-endopeptidase MepM/ murein hydrolase activator NlpD
MHISYRILPAFALPGAFALSLVLASGSLLTGVVTFETRHEAAESLEESLGVAARSYQRRQGLKAMESRGARDVDEERLELARIGRAKRGVRLQIAQVIRDFALVRVRFAIREESPGRLEELLTQAKREFSRTTKDRYLHGGADDAPERTRSVLRLLLSGEGGRGGTSAWQQEYLGGLQQAADLARTLEGLRERHESLIGDYASAEKAFDRSQGIVRVSRAEQEAIQAIMRDVHEQVLALQGQLSRIDAQLRERAERALMEKGLMTTAPEHSEDAAHPAFSWPAYGSLSAGFLNAKYREHFGVPHYGIDIVVGEGSPVYSAADGIVFLVREGGDLGYTYVLIGHKNAYATLYGHLSSVGVAAGQRVAAGQMIGLSGGKPGTPGAGPMTTGPHLHFEVIQGGTNVDPVDVLP